MAYGNLGGPGTLADKFSKSLGQRLRAARRQRGWSLGEVETNTRGEFKASVVGAYERGERAISVHRFVRLAQVYDVPAAELLPITPQDGAVLDLDAIGADGSDDIVDRFLAAIQLLRKEPGGREVRQSDRSIIASLVQTTDVPAPVD